MPSGYTAGVQSGEITEFKEFALQCARAFSACIELRDERLSSNIPELKVDSYYYESVKNAHAKLLEWRSLPQDKRMEIQRKQHADTLSDAEKYRAERIVQRQRYEAMLVKAMEFVPPTSEHVNLKKFMIEQLQESIKYDCSTEYLDQQEDKTLIPFEQLEQQRTKSLLEEVEHSQKRLDEETEQVAKNNLWIRQLKDALVSQSH